VEVVQVVQQIMLLELKEQIQFLVQLLPQAVVMGQVEFLLLVVLVVLVAGAHNETTLLEVLEMKVLILQQKELMEEILLRRLEQMRAVVAVEHLKLERVPQEAQQGEKVAMVQQVQ
jgi:hypothetical protein